ncbi:flagellar biosynthetic protein FliO [Desulfovibrio litoralis]|uniref:Flagellar protein n=1 Tax=Desulfovibrio litoralis DSM 11393 TaxID=1121455 RepID=A0A1M7TBB3_9BACT|nr:flagellar biosynthetic protein FliO [Desulfovibrio litoralis]SHN67976.1 flagellar biosynthetic protein FliO [Desulfovibrio litoralis DSM 11393]
MTNLFKYNLSCFLCATFLSVLFSSPVLAENIYLTQAQPNYIEPSNLKQNYSQNQVGSNTTYSSQQNGEYNQNNAYSQPASQAQNIQPQVQAQTQAQIKTKTQDPSNNATDLTFTWGAYLKGIGAVFFLLTVLLLCLWFVKRYGVGKFKAYKNKASNLELIESISVGPKKNIVLLRAKEQMFLIGLSDTNINMLGEVYGDLDETPKQNTSKKKQTANNLEI